MQRGCCNCGGRDMGWKNPPTNFAKEVTQEVGRIYRGFAITVLNNLILLSPVDTGRYRANHLLSFGAPDATVSEQTDRSGSVTLAAGVAAINGIPDGTFPVIYIQNNLPYALELELGSSRQAPNGVYALSFQSARAAYS
ncbi:MAG: HK97 gp10 family phage protein [Pseudomonadota bacterium]|nr:HK97 gp10 family phage protein [Pseudomonadota bacterium]